MARISRCFGNHQLLVVAAEVLALLNQGGDLGLVQKVLVEPGELRQHLQVGIVAGDEVRLRPLRAIAGRAIAFPQLAIARIAPNHVHRVRLEQILQREAPLGRRQLRRRLGHQVKKRIVRVARDVILDLCHQRRNQVEVLVDVGKLVQQFHHPVVVLEGVQPDPGKAILAGDHVFVERLVHVPEQHQPDFRGTVMSSLEEN